MAANVGSCAVPRLLSFEYGASQCTTQKNDGDARTAVLFRTDESWQSWRVRRAMMHASSMPGVFSSALRQKLAAAGIDCPIVGATSAASAHGFDARPADYIGWRFTDAVLPISAMRRALNRSLARPPPKHGGAPARAAFTEWQREVCARARSPHVARM